MNSIALTITLRPDIKEKLLKESKRCQVSMSRYIDELLAKKFKAYDDEDYTYTLEELDRDSKEAKKLSDEGKLPSFDNVEDAFKFLGV